jgi:hypothetical protein
MPDHLRLARPRLGPGRRLAAEHGAGGALGVEVVRLAAPAAQPAVGLADLVGRMALLTEEARQAGAVGARALDAEGEDGAQGPGPCLELAVAVETDPDGQTGDARRAP